MRYATLLIFLKPLQDKEDHSKKRKNNIIILSEDTPTSPRYLKKIVA
jgi:hypothetical protein